MLPAGLTEGYELVINQGLMDQQLERWNEIYTKTLAAHMARVGTVDLRYSNGAAVAWKQDVAHNNRLLNGGHH